MTLISTTDRARPSAAVAPAPGQTLPVPIAPHDTGLVAIAHAVLERHGRSFALAGRLLPRDRRDDAAIVYAFCRLVDDTADEADSPDQARAGLDQVQLWLRAGREHHEATAASPSPRVDLGPEARRVVDAFVEVCRRRGIDLGAAEELILGVRGDLGPVEFADDAELIRYGYRVAGTVGWMMCGVLGVTDAKALAQAIDLGVAMQITNICRDVRQDAGMGRVYLPATRLAAVGIAPGDLRRGAVDRAALAGVVRDLLALADVYYRSAAGAFAAIPLRARVAIVVASTLYRAIGRRLELRHGADPWHGRTVVPGWRKALLVVTSLLGSLRYGAWSRRPHQPALHRPLAGLPGAAVDPSARC